MSLSLAIREGPPPTPHAYPRSRPHSYTFTSLTSLLPSSFSPPSPSTQKPQAPPTPEQVWRLLVDPKGEQQRVAQAVKGGIGLAPVPRSRASRHAGRQTAEREAGSPLSSVSEGRMVMRSSVSSVASSMADSPKSAVGTNTVEVLKLHARRRRHPLRPHYVIVACTHTDPTHADRRRPPFPPIRRLSHRRTSHPLIVPTPPRVSSRQLTHPTVTLPRPTLHQADPRDGQVCQGREQPEPDPSRQAPQQCCEPDDGFSRCERDREARGGDADRDEQCFGAERQLKPRCNAAQLSRWGHAGHCGASACLPVNWVPSGPIDQRFN